MKHLLRYGLLAAITCAPQFSQAAANAIYAMSNDATDNRIYGWKLGFMGSFMEVGNWSTGGVGTGQSETPGAGPVDGIDPLGARVRSRSATTDASFSR